MHSAERRAARAQLVEPVRLATRLYALAALTTRLRYETLDAALFMIAHGVRYGFATVSAGNTALERMLERTSARAWAGFFERVARVRRIGV